MVFEDDKPCVVFVSSSDSDGVVGSSPNDYRKIMTENEVEYLSHVMKSGIFSYVIEMKMLPSQSFKM